MSTRPEQLSLDGLDPNEAPDDDFASLIRLDDETCRIGLIHMAEMRRILAGFADTQAA